MGNDTSHDDSMFRYLGSAFPDFIDSKSADGLAPLLLAFE